MGVINNKWFQAVVVLLVVSFLANEDENAAAGAGFFAMLFVFVPKLRKMAKLDTIVAVKETPKKTKRGVSAKGEESLSADNLDSYDESNASLKSQDAWLEMSNTLWGGGQHLYPDWIGEAQENCQKEAWEYFTSIENKVENDEAFAKKIEQEFDLSAYDKFKPKEQDWIDPAINAYLNRAMSMPNFEKKYRKS